MQAKILQFPPTQAATERRGAELANRALQLAPADGVNRTIVERIALIRATSPTQPLPALYDPCLCIVLQGSKRAALNGTMYTYDALNYLLVAVTLPVVAQIIEASPARPYLAMRLELDVAAIRELVLQMPPPAVVKPEAEGLALNIGAMHEDMLDAVIRLVHLLEHPADAPVLAPLVLREIYFRLLKSELAPRVRELCGVDTHMDRIARVISAIKTNFAQPLRVEELAALAHMSTSALHRRFKAVTSLSPLQFQKQLRLHHARTLLLEGADAATAAYRVGYESASQFNREYRRLFGAPPKREIQALRDPTR